jgi:ribosomal protein S18 acetylase RimI-like enzyme
VVLNVWEGNENAKHFYEKVGMKVRSMQMEYLLD